MSAKVKKSKPGSSQAGNSEDQSQSSSSRNYSEVENTLIRQLVSKYKHIVENKKSDAVSNQKKYKTWKLIETEFNAQGHTKRNADSLKRKWENMKSRTKNDYDRVRSSLLATGGGPAEADVSSQSRLVHEIIAPQVDPMNNLFDDDQDMNRGPPEVAAEVEIVGNAVILYNLPEPEPANDERNEGIRNDFQPQNNDQDHENQQGGGERSKRRRKCNFAQEELLEMERDEHGIRMILLHEKLESTRVTSALKEQNLLLKKEYFTKKLNGEID